MGNKIGVITCVHITPRDDAPWTQFGQDEYRRYSTAETRLTNFLNAMHARGDIELCVQKGDFIDALPVEDYVARLITAVGYVAASDWGGDFYNVIGNHCKTRFDLGGWSDYESNINNSAYDDAWQEDGIDKAFSWDKNGIHYIVLFCPYTNDMSESQRNWLIADLAATELPVVVFTHAHLCDSVSTSPVDYINVGNASIIRGILEGDGNVQCVIEGHYHTGHDPVWINDILYIGMRGSVFAPEAGDNAYYAVEIIPNAVWGSSRMRANIEVTGYSLGSTKTFDKFIV